MSSAKHLPVFRNVWCLQVLQSLEKQLDRLKDKAPASGTEGEVGDRLEKLQRDAGRLADTTDNMLETLEGNTVKQYQYKSVF